MPPRIQNVKFPQIMIRVLEDVARVYDIPRVEMTRAMYLGLISLTEFRQTAVNVAAWRAEVEAGNDTGLMTLGTLEVYLQTSELVELQEFEEYWKISVNTIISLCLAGVINRATLAMLAEAIPQFESDEEED